MFKIFYLFVFAIFPLSANCQPLNGSAWDIELREVLHRITGDDAKAFLGFSPKFFLINAEKPTAFTFTGEEIYFTSSILEMAKDKNELAFIMAHELAHGMLQHHKHASFFTGSLEKSELLVRQELEADALALKLLRESGFDPGHAAKLVEKIMIAAKSLGLKPEDLGPSLAIRKQFLKNADNYTQKLHIEYSQ